MEIVNKDWTISSQRRNHRGLQIGELKSGFELCRQVQADQILAIHPGEPVSDILLVHLIL